MRKSRVTVKDKRGTSHNCLAELRRNCEKVSCHCERYARDFPRLSRRTQEELCESRGGRPGFPVPNSLYGLCGRKETL